MNRFLSLAPYVVLIASVVEVALDHWDRAVYFALLAILGELQGWRRKSGQ